MSWAEVEFIGGHLDGAVVKVPADVRGVPAAEFRVLTLPGGARWDAGPGIIEVAVQSVVYRRHAHTVGGELLAWRMVADG